MQILFRLLMYTACIFTVIALFMQQVSVFEATLLFWVVRNTFDIDKLQEENRRNKKW